MSIHKFFPQNSSVEAAALADLLGTCTTKERMLNYRRSSYAVVSTVSGGAYWFRIDLGASATLAPTFIAFVDHTLYDIAGATDLLLDSSPDAVNWTNIAGDSTVAADSPIWVHTFSAPANARRYFRVRLGAVTGNVAAGLSKWGCLLLGTYVEPTLEPNYEGVVEHDSSGTILNRTSGGAKYAVQRYTDMPIRSVGYELIPTADVTTLEGLRTTVSGSLKPFVFVVDSGSGTATYRYGRFVKDSFQKTQTASGLWAVKFGLEEEIA